MLIGVKAILFSSDHRVLRNAAGRKPRMEVYIKRDSIPSLSNVSGRHKGLHRETGDTLNIAFTHEMKVMNGIGVHLPKAQGIENSVAESVLPFTGCERSDRSLITLNLLDMLKLVLATSTFMLRIILMGFETLKQTCSFQRYQVGDE